MTHTTELKTLEERLLNSGWVTICIEREYWGDEIDPNVRHEVKGDYDYLGVKFNFVGMNILYIEEKSGAGKLKKATEQIHRAIPYIIEAYNPDRIFCFYCHKQENKLVEVYEK